MRILLSNQWSNQICNRNYPFPNKHASIIAYLTDFDKYKAKKKIKRSLYPRTFKHFSRPLVILAAAISLSCEVKRIRLFSGNSLDGIIAVPFETFTSSFLFSLYVIYFSFLRGEIKSFSTSSFVCICSRLTALLTSNIPAFTLTSLTRCPNVVSSVPKSCAIERM